LSSRKSKPGTINPRDTDDGVPEHAGVLFRVGEVANFGVVHIEFFKLSTGVICVAISL
jgi:hypothetical protein